MIQEALIFSMLNDSTLAVRIKALSLLASCEPTEEIQEVFMMVLSGEEAVQMPQGGNIEAPDASGANLETMGGNISIGSLDGWVHATTMGGRISVSMVGDPSSGRRDVRLESKGGNIELGLPKGLSMEVDVTLAYTKRSSQQYSIESEFPLTIRRTDYWDHDSGDPRKYIYGRATIGGGTHKVKIETVNGDVRIFRSAGK